MKRWHYAVGGVRRGPVCDADLRALAASGRLRPTDLVWRAGLADWTPAANLKGLFPTDGPPPLPGKSDSPPPLPAGEPARRLVRSPDEPRHLWRASEIWVCMIVTLGLFSLYLIPSWSRPVELKLP